MLSTLLLLADIATVLVIQHYRVGSFSVNQHDLKWTLFQTSMRNKSQDSRAELKVESSVTALQFERRLN